MTSFKSLVGLLNFVRQLALEDTRGKVCNEVLQLLWDLAHRPDASRTLIEQARKGGR